MITLRQLIILSAKEKYKILSAPRVLFLTSIAYEENRIKIGKYNINYLKVGKGAHNVLCMPGALGSIWTDFKPQVEGFDKEQFSLIVWDPPGYGKSRPPEREFHDDYYGQDVAVALELMKALNISKFSVMGWSYGGVSSMILAAKYPEIVRNLVVWGASSFFLRHEIDLYKKIKDVRIWPDKTREPMIQLYGEEKFSTLWSEVIDAMVAVYNAKDGNICSEVLQNVSCPTLILFGEKDPLVDKVHVSYLHTNIQGSRIYLYPDGKHDIHLRYKEDFNRRVQEFLLQN